MESIYKWVEPSPVRPERPPLYHSKHDPNYPIVGSTMVKPSYSTTSYASLGTDKLKETVKPDLFLKKGSGALLAKTLRAYVLPRLAFFFFFPLGPSFLPLLSFSGLPSSTSHPFLSFSLFFPQSAPP